MSERILVHEVTLDGYKASADSKILDLGTWGSYGIEKLHLTLGKAWEGLVITAHFNVKGEVVANALADVDNMMDVPWEATKENTFAGRIVFEGDMNGQRRLTSNLNFKVTNHGEYKGSDPVPTDDKWNQFVTETKGYREDALAAANRALQSEQASENAKQEVVDLGNKKQQEIRGLSNGEKQAISELTDTKLKALQDESATQLAAITKKGADTLATIPEEYTQLNNDVGQLKEDLSNLSLHLKTLPTDTFYAENPYAVYTNQEAYHTNVNMALSNVMDLTNDIIIFGLTIHRNADGTLRLTGTPTDGICTFKYSKAHFRAGRYYTLLPSNVTASLRSISYSVDFNSSFTATKDTDELWYTIKADSAVDITIQPMLYDRDAQYGTDYIKCKWENVSGKFIAYDGINHILAKDDVVLTFETLNNKCKPEFWGAIGNGGDDTTPLNEMMKYCSANKESIEFSKKTYGIKYPISILGAMDVNFNYAVIKALQDVSALFFIECETDDQFHGMFRNCILDGDLKAESCIVVLKNINAMSFENLQVYDPKKYGIWCKKDGGGEFYNIMLRSRHDDGVARTALQIEAPDTKWKSIKAVNFCTFAYVKGITHMEQVHPFITYSSYNTKSIAIYVDGTSIFITNSYIDTYFRCFFNPNIDNRGYGSIFATNVMFFWSKQYFTGAIRPSICYNGILCRLVNCRVHRPDGTESKSLLFGEQGENDKT